MITGFERDAEILHEEYYHGNWPGYRAWPSRGMPEKTQVVHLYNVGDGVSVPGTYGLVTAAESARIVAGDLTRRLRRVE